MSTIRSRRSVRVYKDLEIDEKDLNQILESGLLAPSSKNKRPVKFIVVKNKETLQKLKDCKDKGTLGLDTCPLSIVIVGDKELSDVWVEDCSAAISFMQLEIQKLGLGSCWIQIRKRTVNEQDSEECVKKVLSLEEKYGVLAILTIGHKDENKRVYEDKDVDYSRVIYK